MNETLKTIRLTWAQLVWGVGIVFLLGGQWFQLNALATEVRGIKEQLRQAVYTRTEIDLMRQAADREHAKLWEAIREVMGGSEP